MLGAFIAIGLLQFVTMLLQLVRTKALALALGPELVGIMAVIDRLTAVLSQTASLSIPFAALRFLPERWTESPTAFALLYRRMAWLLAGLSAVAMVLTLGVTVVRSEVWGAQLLPYRTAVMAASLTMPVLVLVPFLRNAVAGRLQENRSMFVALAHAAVAALAVAAVWWHGLVGYYTCYAVLGLVLVIVVGKTVGRVPGPRQAIAPPSGWFGLPRQVWRFSGALLVVAFFSPYAALLVHYGVLREHGAVTAGWMQAPVGIGLAVRTLLGTAHAVFLTPNVNRGGDPADRMAWANRYQETFCLLAVTVLPPLLLFPQLAVRLLYSSAFGPGATYVVLFVLVEIVTLLAGTYGALVVALDHLGFHVVQNVLAQLLVSGLAAWLIRPFGILGAGLALLSAPMLLYLGTTSFLRWRHRLQVTRRATNLGALLTVTLVVTGLFGARAAPFSPASIGLKLALYGVVIAVVLVMLTAEERSKLWNGVWALRGRLTPTRS